MHSARGDNGRRGTRQLLGHPCHVIESELFGREKQAYTGATARQVGRFELVHRSMIFLDDIGDLSVDTQVKLLRVLEERQFERLGSRHAFRVDTRIIAATHRNLEEMIAAGTFREDSFETGWLYSRSRCRRSGSGRRHSPPGVALRRGISKRFGNHVEFITDENMSALRNGTGWPGKSASRGMVSIARWAWRQDLA